MDINRLRNLAESIWADYESQANGTKRWLQDYRKEVQAYKEYRGREIFERSYIPERILSGTGAGDTSIAAFLTAVLKGCGPEECLHLAAAAGASCVAEYDALSGIGTLRELEEKINRGWKKI